MKILNKTRRRENSFFMTVFALIAVLVTGCSSGDQSTINDPTKFSSVATVKCTADTTQQYEVYTPTTFDGKGTLPVIFLFDAHADGKLSIEKFKFGAEKFGYMLAASDNSKNGAANIEYIIQALFTDVLQKYPVNRNRMYAGGFSGGARVALSAAVEMKNIKGIFIAGAGLSGMDVKQVSPKFDIYATAGYSDFNYNEVAIIPEELKNTDWRWIVSNFEGTHGWPPQEVTTEAVEWFTFNAMKDGLVPKNNGLVKQYSSLFMSSIDSLQEYGRYIDASKECTKATAFLDKLTPVKKFKKRLGEIENTTGYKNERQKWIHSLQMEEDFRSGYMECLSTRDTTWWVHEIAVLNAKTIHEPNRYNREVYARVKGYLGIVLYSFTGKALGFNQLEEAEKLLKIYRTLEPENPDMFFFTAIYYDRINKPKEAEAELKQAFDKGFTDRAKLAQMASTRLMATVK